MLARGLRTLPETRLIAPPRMADFSYRAVACGLDGFEAAYASNRQDAVNALLETDQLAQNLLALVTKEWRGTAQDLLDALGPGTRITDVRALGNDLRRLAPLLRTAGLDISHEKRTSAHRMITIIRR